jgi:hypothetical protein
MRTLAGISYDSCKLCKDFYAFAGGYRGEKRTGARSGMNRSPRTRTSLEAIAGDCGRVWDISLGTRTERKYWVISRGVRRLGGVR